MLSVLLSSSQIFRNVQTTLWCVEYLCACQKYELSIWLAFHWYPNCVQDNHVADRRENLTPPVSKKFILGFVWAHRLCRLCYKTSASSSSSIASETRKTQKNSRDIWMCWKLWKVCSSQKDETDWPVLGNKSHYGQYQMDRSSLERQDWWREKLCRKSASKSAWTISWFWCLYLICIQN